MLRSFDSLSRKKKINNVRFRHGVPANWLLLHPFFKNIFIADPSSQACNFLPSPVVPTPARTVRVEKRGRNRRIPPGSVHGRQKHENKKNSDRREHHMSFRTVSAALPTHLRIINRSDYHL